MTRPSEGPRGTHTDLFMVQLHDDVAIAIIHNIGDSVDIVRWEEYKEKTVCQEDENRHTSI